MADFTVRARIEAEDRASAVVGKAQGSFQKFGSFLASRFVVTFGDVARLVENAMGQIRKALDLRAQQQALKAQLGAAGQNFDTFISKLKEVSDSTVSTANLIDSSSKALLLGIPADQIASLLEIARASAVATGTSVAKAFDDIATGIGRASPLILDNLGITVKLGDAYQAMATKLGTTTEQLDATQKKQALLNAVLEVGEQRVELFGDAVGGLKQKLEQGDAALTDFTNAVADYLAKELDATIDDTTRVFGNLVKIFDEAARPIRALIDLNQQFAEAMRELFPNFPRIEEGVQNVVDTLGGLPVALGPSITGLEDYAIKLGVTQESLDTVTRVTGDYAKALRILIDSQERVLQIETEIDAARKGSFETLAKLGIKTTEQLVQSQKDLGKQLEDINKLYEAGELQTKQFVAAQQEIIDEQNAIQAVLDGTATSVTEYLGKLREARAVHEEFNAGVDGSRVSLEELGRQADNTADQVIQAAARSRQAVFISQARTRDQRAGRDFSTSSFPVTIGGGTFTTRNPANNFIPARTA